MRLRHIKGAEEEIAESPYVVQDPQSLKGRWHEFFETIIRSALRSEWGKENSSWSLPR
jgi:hypothetical protein